MSSNIYLCGFMGSGKTTTGQNLARLLGRPFIDLDDYIEAEQGRPIAAIFAQSGEAAFREIESQALHTLGRQKGMVIATGGGALLREENARFAKSNGEVVLLALPFDQCYERIAADTQRPLVAANPKEKLEQIYRDRMPLYQKAATITVDGTGSPLEIAKEIIRNIS